MRGKNSSRGLAAVAFGLGLVVSMICPEKWLIAILAIVVILLGAASLKC